jgi:hypothetical protein
MNSNQLLGVSQEHHKDLNSKLSFMSWSILQVQSEAYISNCVNPWNSKQIQPNSIGYQTLELPWILIQILVRIFKSSNKESCSLFNSLQIHILFEFFWGLQDLLLTESIQVNLKMFWINRKCHCSFGPAQINRSSSLKKHGPRATRVIPCHAPLCPSPPSSTWRRGPDPPPHSSPHFGIKICHPPPPVPVTKFRSPHQGFQVGKSSRVDKVPTWWLVDKSVD